MILLDELGRAVGGAFSAENLSAEFGKVRPSDRPDLCQFQCNGPLAAAKGLGVNPRTLATTLAERLRSNALFASVEVAGPGFLNFIVRDAVLSGRINEMADDDFVGGWRAESPEKLVLDYGGPNIAKPLHVGHLRSAIIGESLKRLFRFVGDVVVGDVHLGDWGLPMGQLISELARERPDLPYFDAGHAGPFPTESPVSLDDLERLYPRASAACKADPARAAEAREATAALQKGRPGYRALWRHFIAVSRVGLEREYADLDVTFDLWNGESDVDERIEPMVADLRTRGLAEIDAGAEIVRVAREGDKKEIPPLILYKSDGAVMYGTTDLATIVDRRDTLAPARMLYVVDGRQRDHFVQVFRASDAAGYFPEERLEHLWFGTMNGKDGKPFKTRAGDVVRLRDVIDLVRDKARERLNQSGFAEGYGEVETANVAHKVGVAALKFADLQNPRTSDYVFDLERFSAFEGKTGPYLLYAAVRVRSLLRKAQDAGFSPGVAHIGAAEERALALRLIAFGDAVRTACQKRMPHFLCDHAFDLAQAFSAFYASSRILDEAEDSVRRSRLAFAAITGRQLETCLGLLGISVPERM